MARPGRTPRTAPAPQTSTEGENPPRLHRWPLARDRGHRQRALGEAPAMAPGRAAVGRAGAGPEAVCPIMWRPPAGLARHPPSRHRRGERLAPPTRADQAVADQVHDAGSAASPAGNAVAVASGMPFGSSVTAIRTSARPRVFRSLKATDELGRDDRALLSSKNPSTSCLGHAARVATFLPLFDRATQWLAGCRPTGARVQGLLNAGFATLASPDSNSKWVGKPNSRDRPPAPCRYLPG